MTTHAERTAPYIPAHDEIAGLADAAVEQVRVWLAASREIEPDSSAKLLADVLRDPNGLEFTVGFVDRVVRPEDLHVAGRALRELSPLMPRFLPLPMRALFRVGAALGPVTPRLVVPAARRVLRHLVRHLIIDASNSRLGAAIAKLRSDGSVQLNINLLGEAILGEGEAAHRLAGTRDLIARDDVDYVSVKVSSVVAPHTPWALDEAVADAVDALAPLYELAASTTPATFINLDMEEYKDLDLTIAVFTRLLERPQLHTYSAGIVLQAYLPDALGAMTHLQQWAAERVAAGGAPIKVRVVKGANLPMETVDAELHGWPLATWESKKATDASYKAVLDYALRAEHTGAVRVGVAGHNLFDVALAMLLARQRGVTDAVDVEMLLGMASAQAEVVRRDAGSMLLYTPVVHPDEFDVAIAYLIRRLEEGASSENFMSAVFDLDDPAMFARERDRFLASVAEMPMTVPRANRVEDRTQPPPPVPAELQPVHRPFENTPDSDPAIAANRAWADAIRARMQASTLGTAITHVASPDELDALVARTVEAGAGWRELAVDERARILHAAGDALEAHRADLLEIMGAECGKVLEQGDPEVSEAIDFAHYYAVSAQALHHVPGARPEPVSLTVVTPPWNFPVAIPAGSTLAALAAGSPVIIKPAHPSRRSAQVMVEALWEAGVPRDVLACVQLDEHSLGERLISDARVERVILTGSYETAELFRSFRPALPLLAETSGKNAIIVTPSADLDLAAKDVVYSAFGHAGQKCSAASLVVLVGSVATSERFRRQLVDAVSAYTVGMPWEASSRIGPLIGPADGKLLRALTSVEPGQSWLVEPKRLDEAGTLWRPGIRLGVQPGSEYHLVEYFGPVLGVMTADTLDEAIDLVNQVSFGLTSGLHSLDDAEIQQWLGLIEAGNLYVNRGTTGAIVQLQPFGGWKRSVVGAGWKAGGPSYLYGLTRWVDDPATAAVSSASASDPLSAGALAAAEHAGAGPEDVAWLRNALATDAAVWAQELGVVRDVSGLVREQNAFRYQAVPVTLRFESARVVELLRVVAAGWRAGSRVSVSARRYEDGLERYLGSAGVTWWAEDDAQWALRVA
ncbi:MAG: bifunctional proline dehydrogenase/L-glutamate gamma-semialdehyde dehydrogenase, partial [Actinobacteria bacterium]|nr:bifunctional proline dehydrogenase/L-glutamate gamma-semialdehyde dehydrogenase [Actinomycetota bacterium]